MLSAQSQIARRFLLFRETNMQMSASGNKIIQKKIYMSHLQTAVESNEISVSSYSQKVIPLITHTRLFLVLQFI